MIVSLEHVFKYYGADCILRDVNAAINEKDRIGLVGANGEGKTTLLNVLTGGLDYEEGSVSLTNGKVIGYLHQNSGLSNGRTIQQEMEAVFADLIALGQEVDALQKQMAQFHDNPQEYERVSAEYQKKLARFEAKDGYQIEVKINTVLNGMGFGNYDRNIVTNNLSGGEKTRLATARLLLLEPDLLILDEPTNHLDFKTLNWLEDYLSSYKGALLVVSHDRYFLNRLVDHIWELERTVLTTYRGNYSSYVVQKKERVERQLKEYEQQQEQIKSMEEYVAKNIARASTSKSAKSRIAALERMYRIEKPVIWEKKAAFRFTYDEPPVKDVFHGEGMSIAVGEGENRKVLCRNMKLDVMRGEKIAIISDKAQTTRTRITGVLTEGEVQLVFIDTPGLHKPKNKLGDYMVKQVSDSVGDVDCAVLVTDPFGEIVDSERQLIENIKELHLPAILVINKIDTLANKEDMVKKMVALSEMYDFTEVVPISVKERDGTDLLLKLIQDQAQEGPHFFPSDTLTDQPEKVIAAEIIREKVLRNMRDEIPHGTAVVIERMRERQGKNMMDIDATILCEKASHKGMIIGKKGAMLKKIASESRQEIEAFLDSPVNLQCWVKIREDWRNNEFSIRDLGFN